MLVTLHGMIPVYVQVDTGARKVAYVCASDEEFTWVGRRIDDEDGRMHELHRISESDRPLPLGYDENGNLLDDDGLIERAYRIAESIPEPGALPETTEWPAWSWGW